MKDFLNDFFTQFTKAGSRLLMLDYDGTLAPFRVERDQAFAYPGVEQRLDRIIAGAKTDVVIISGRAIADLRPLLKLRKYPEMWGSHGWEVLSAEGKYRLLPAEADARQGLIKAENYIRDNGFAEHLEVKPVSLAIHYRGVEIHKLLVMKEKISNNWNSLTSEYNLTFSEFDGGLELKIPGLNKGTVVKTLMERYSVDCPTAYLGDDLTDEDAFKALPDSALSVLVRPVYRETKAKAWIKPPEELLEFFDRWIEADDIS